MSIVIDEGTRMIELNRVSLFGPPLCRTVDLSVEAFPVHC
jgi:hypothetical protein